MITTSQMYDVLRSIPGRNIELNNFQHSIIEHDNGPLWIIAGPGSGKTEVLVLKCLKLLLVDGVDPRAIIVTTFTEKAGRNLKDRLINYKTFISKAYPELNKIDLFQLRVETLHSLCNSIMLEYRYSGYKNYRPLDDLEQLLFIYFHCPLVTKSENGRSKLTTEEIGFWKTFSSVWGRGRARYYLNRNKVPSRWIRARTLQTFFNRIVEDLIDIEKMRKAGSEWQILAEAYEQYVASLEENYRVDFAHIQAKFIKFLNHQLGKTFVKGEKSSDHPGLKYLLVDEYQDTNPIQEEIYLKLCEQSPHNITVVGDDDQALYRFRGGTVECMINFGATVKKRFRVDVTSIPLVENYRSHKNIVKWCNEYINSFDVMRKQGARSPNKPNLIAKSNIDGQYPAVALLSGRNTEDLATKFANLVKDLLDKKIVNYPSDCVLLMRSTKESEWGAGPFMDALAEKEIRLYNPRAKNYLEQQEIQMALGAFLSIVDPDPDYEMVFNNQKIIDICNQWRQVYETASFESGNQKLRIYVEEAKKQIRNLELEQKIQTSMQEILYHILNCEPFLTWLDDPERTVRLGELTRLFEAYSASPVPKKLGLLRGDLKGSSKKKGEISWFWRQTFYNSFISLIIEKGLDDPEDEDEIYPLNYFPIMTVHQSKGLEFPFVFVAGLDAKDEPGPEHILEQEMARFRKDSVNLAAPEDRVKQDSARFYYVAFSRARYALIILAKEDDLETTDVKNQPEALGGKARAWFNQLVRSID